MEPKAEPKSRYVEGKQVIALAESVLAARQVVGRGKLAELLDTTQSAVWRWENGRVHPDELDGLISGMSQVDERIEQGDFVKPERQPKVSGPTKAELQHRIEAAVEYLRGGTKGQWLPARATSATMSFRAASAPMRAAVASRMNWVTASSGTMRREPTRTEGSCFHSSIFRASRTSMPSRWAASGTDRKCASAMSDRTVQHGHRTVQPSG